MIRLIGTLKEGMLTFATLVLVWVLFHRARKTNQKTCVSYCLVSLYLAVVWMLVGMPDAAYIRLDLSGNLIPFQGMVQDLKNGILNAVLFVPLGIFLPLFWKPYRRSRKTISFGFGLSVVIEVLQIFTYRATDVNDVITNTLGTVLGFLIWKLLMSNRTDLALEKKSLPLLFGITFGIMFFLHPILYKLSWNLFG